MLYFIQLSIAALLDMPPTKAATGQQGGGWNKTCREREDMEMDKKEGDIRGDWDGEAERNKGQKANDGDTKWESEKTDGENRDKNMKCVWERKTASETGTEQKSEWETEYRRQLKRRVETWERVNKEWEKMGAEPPRFLCSVLADLMRLDQVWEGGGGREGLVTAEGIEFPRDKHWL